MMVVTVMLPHVKIKDYMIVAMANVSILLGNVMAGQTVLMAQMKLTAVLHLVQIKVYGIVVMANVSPVVMYVMDQVNFVTLAGVLTVLMAQMKAWMLVVMQMNVALEYVKIVYMILLLMVQNVVMQLPMHLA